jgi:peroxiredoxin Q/BCP
VEGRALRDRADAFAAAGCVVLGASFDTVAANNAFADEQRFGFRLLADHDRAVGARYEVVRAADDQYAAYPLRHSFLIDPQGVIRQVYAVSDVAAHADDVLADLARLRAVS